MSDPTNINITATDKTKKAFASVESNLNKLATSTGSLTSFASASGVAAGSLDRFGKAGQAVAGSLGVLTLSMQTFGGPAGILLGVVAGIAGYVLGTDEAVEKTTDFNKRLEQLQGNMVAIKAIELADEIAKTKREIEDLQDKWKTGPGLFGSREEYYKDQESIREGTRLVNSLNRQLEHNRELQRAGVTDEGAYERDRQNLQKKIEAIQASFLTEDERLAEHLLNQQGIVDQAFEAEFITKQERNILLEELELQHQAKIGNIEAQGIIARRKFEEMNAKRKTQTILGEMISLTQGVAQHNKTMFEINKVASIANATVNAFTAFTTTQKAYPEPWGSIMGGIALASGLAQVSAIASTSFGGGGGTGTTPSAAGATPVVNSQPVPVATQQQQAQVDRREVTINLSGSGYSRDDVRELIQQINEEVGNGVELITA